MSSLQLSFYIQDINCSHVTYFTLPYIMWIETQEIDLAVDTQGKHNIYSMNGKYKIARGAVEIVHRKLRMRLLLPWQKLKITSAIFSQTLNTKLVSPPVLIF